MSLASAALPDAPALEPLPELPPAPRVVDPVAGECALTPTRVLHDQHVYQKHEEARYWRDRAVAAERPPAWYDRPGVQRWAGRIETLVAVAAAIVVVREAEGR